MKLIPKNVLYFSLTLLVFLFIADKNIYSQNEGPTTYKIVSLSVIGNKLYDARTIISYSGLKENQEISIPSDETRDAIRKLWNLSLFSNIEIYVDKKFGKEVYIVISVKELPRIEKVEIVGNDKYSESDLKDKIGLVSGQVVSDQKLKDIEYNLTRYYIEEGYSLAEVNVDKFISASNETRIRIKIKEGHKLTVRSIDFVGNRHVKSKELKKAMDNTSEKVWWKFWDGATFDKNKFEDDKKLIVYYYKEKGYKDAEIKGTELNVSPDKEDMFIKIKVDEGKQFFINSVKVEGNKIYPDSLLLSRLDMHKGDVYNFKKLQKNLYGTDNESESDISSLYLDNGYLGYNSDLDEQIVDINKINLVIKITENRQYRLGMISFEGNDKTKDKVMRREMYTIPGDYFNRGNVKRSMQQLNALNYFNPEKLNQDIALENDSTVNLKYIVNERSSDQFNASVGYSGTFGVTGSLGLTFNNFDISEPFTGGGGQSLNFNWQFGEAGNYRTFSIGYQEPWLYDTPTSLGFSLFDTRTNYTYDIRETGAILNLGRRFKFPDDYFRGDWAIKVQRTDVINGGGYYQTGLRNQFSVKQTITRSTVFDPLFPQTGTRVSNSTELSGGPFFPGNINFIKDIFTAEAYTPVIKNQKLILYSNFNFYFVNPFEVDKYLPPTELFYMGGNGLAYNTIALRGYDDRNIGPKDAAYNPLGGKVAIKYGVELRYPLSMDPFPIYLLAFAEAGNIWADINKTDPFDLRRSVGFGTRLYLPAVGLIGFDFGYGFDRLIEDRVSPKFIFHFQFGKGF
jgi:outer membrane protein insertion porin family